MVCQSQKNLKITKKESSKNWHPQSGLLWIGFQFGQTKPYLLSQ